MLSKDSLTFDVDDVPKLDIDGQDMIDMNSDLRIDIGMDVASSRSGVWGMCRRGGVVLGGSRIRMVPVKLNFRILQLTF